MIICIKIIFKKREYKNDQSRRAEEHSSCKGDSLNEQSAPTLQVSLKRHFLPVISPPSDAPLI